MLALDELHGERRPACPTARAVRLLGALTLSRSKVDSLLIRRAPAILLVPLRSLARRERR